MEWYSLFKQHILNRGAEYHQDGYVSKFEMTEREIMAEVEGTKKYHVNIELDGEDVLDMVCDCPYAESGNNCKHMAAVLFCFEEKLYDEDVAREAVSKNGIEEYSWQDMYEKKREKVVALVNKIPVEDVREMLVQYVLNDDSLRNKLELEYAEQLDARQMLALKEEIYNIERNNSRGGFVDWYHASDFTMELHYFLETKVKLLIERNYLDQAFELTNIVFQCIGNIDMDDSEGGSLYVADTCYECWKLILEKSDEQKKLKIKKWFEGHLSGYVIDFMEEYLQEFLFSEFPSDELLREKIEELDEIIRGCSGKNECTRIYSLHYGYENVIIKRIKYMKMLNCTEKEILDFRKKNRHFFVIRELEIEEALAEQDYEKAKQLLMESKELDAEYLNQVQKYSKQLIDLYNKNGEVENCRRELLYQLENYYHSDLKYFLALKEVTPADEWENTVNQIVSSNQHLQFVCKILNEEKRYQELMDRIEKSDNIYLLDEYEKNLRNALPDSVIELYKRYVLKEAQRVSDRNGYRHLMQYMTKISKCPGGREVASRIAEQWRMEYKRRSAMMDELEKLDCKLKTTKGRK